MSAASYFQLRRQRTNLSCAVSNISEAQTLLINYRNALQATYQAKEQEALLRACDECIDKLQYMIHHAVTLKEQLAYCEQMCL